MYQARIEAAPTRESELVELTRDYDTLQQLHGPAHEERGVEDRGEPRTPADRRAVQDPRPGAHCPRGRSAPIGRSINLMASLGGLGLGLALVGACSSSAITTLRTDDDVRDGAALPVLAADPADARRAERRAGARRGSARGIGVAASSPVVGWRRGVGVVWQLRTGPVMYETFYGLQRAAVRSDAESAFPVLTPQSPRGAEQSRVRHRRRGRGITRARSARPAPARRRSSGRRSSGSAGTATCVHYLNNPTLTRARVRGDAGARASS